MEENKYPILDKIHTDAELKALSDADAKALCAELRCFLVDKVTKSGGHLASALSRSRSPYTASLICRTTA